MRERPCRKPAVSGPGTCSSVTTAGSGRSLEVVPFGKDREPPPAAGRARRAAQPATTARWPGPARRWSAP